MNNLITIAPTSIELFNSAVVAAGGVLSPLTSEVRGLIWTDYAHPELLSKALDENPQLEWVQLPWAGVDAFGPLIQRPVLFTCAKGSYKEPVAEHALMLCMALGRKLADRVRAKSWGKKFAVSLYDADVVIVGGGGIAEELAQQLQPFRTNITVVRNRDLPFPGANRVVLLDQLHAVLPAADFVVIACSLTDETRGLFNAETLSRMKPSSYLVNVARGPIVHTDDLLQALANGTIAGAALDVTDPEPLPDGHPAWNEPNLIITPHTADTPVQVEHHLALRIGANVRAFLGDKSYVGQVDKRLGY